MIGCGRRVGGRREDWRRGEVGKEIEKVQKHSSFFHRQKNIKTCLVCTSTEGRGNPKEFTVYSGFFFE